MIPDLLRSAADKIDAHGWARGRNCDPDTGGVCALGAMWTATGVREPQLVATYPGDPDAWRLQQTGAYDRESDRSYHDQIQEALLLVGQYMGLAGITPAVRSNDIPRSPIIRYNDEVAATGGDVQRVLRDAADWIESHPLDTLAAIEATQRPGAEFVPNARLVLA